MVILLSAYYCSRITAEDINTWQQNSLNLVSLLHKIQQLAVFGSELRLRMISKFMMIFASHFGQLAIIFLWTSGNLFHVAWQGNFEQWGEDPLHIRPIAHTIWDPHFGQPAVEAFTRGGASAPVNIAYSGVYQWWYTIGM
ncbi:unnamed protein product, partial [Bathycoccus prasinos]